MGGRKQLFTPEQEDYVRSIGGEYTEYAPLCERLNRVLELDVTPKQMMDWCRRHGRVLAQANTIKWTPDRIEWFREFVPGHTETEIMEAWKERFGFDIRVAQIANGKTRFGVKSGTHGGRFVKGQTSWNKGKKWDDYMPIESQRRALCTCFDGSVMPHNAINKPIGYERITKDGYVEVKIALRPSRRDCNDNFKMKHHIVWEEANGRPVPEGHVVAFADHDTQNFDPDNLVLVSRQIWGKLRKQYDSYHDRESMELAIAKCKLQRVSYHKRLNIKMKCRECGKEFQREYMHQRTCRACLDRRRS